MTKDITRGIKFDDKENGTPSAQSVPGSFKMQEWDYMASLTPLGKPSSILEVQFKNTHKGYYLNPDGVDVHIGDVVVVESQPGVDIGVVVLEEGMVRRKMRYAGFKGSEDELKKVLRVPNQYDIERWREAISLEQSTMIRSRQIAVNLGLEMKIGDVEYQADKMKAIFYYIADGRVDFRELIKVLAEQFHIRVEMKQIGARQEAGRIGGIGSCGRELCCSAWQTGFMSVSINAARIQDITPNPQKLAGQCGKLKCCLNFEADVYEDARSCMPNVRQPLEAMDGNYYLVKSDVLRQVMWFTTDPQSQALQVPLSAHEVMRIQEMNRRGEKPDSLSGRSMSAPKDKQEHTFEDVVGQDSLTRFDKTRKTGKGKKQKYSESKGGNSNPAGTAVQDKSGPQNGENNQDGDKRQEREGTEQKKKNRNFRYGKKNKGSKQ